MHLEKMKHLKETLMCLVEQQMCDLSEVDASELGEVIDMIKDLDEAEYYCTVVKAMENSEEYEDEEERMYYPGRVKKSTRHREPVYHHEPFEREESERKEKEFPYAFDDPREGHSHRARKMYMEAKETHQDKSRQMRELEKYMQELAKDMTELVEGASADERNYVSKKIAALATKIGQTND